MTAEQASAGKANVTVEPAGWCLAVLATETLFDAAWRVGASWPSVCYGQARCTACHVTVVAGQEHILEPDEEERKLLAWIARRDGTDETKLRLACRLRITGPVLVVHPRAVGPPDADGHSARR